MVQEECCAHLKNLREEILEANLELVRHPWSNNLYAIGINKEGQLCASCGESSAACALNNNTLPLA